ncbi:NnrU family protein [Aurantimonas endophytica]|uniref:Putative membrane protein n=1 Tax=Aurantimonas endophytica TaxID=1522175 RepID=A0A7W6MRD2_9HYPH|nr:NnrU family protein [Aurantimonas endophytica]MBB4004848.1 putative membrane protein [Aurantimonas endophytica]MCO6405658.1 NnrU family protein [Aurantimonas endophytica]
MLILVTGMIIFLGIHSVRIFAESARDRMIDRLGEGRYKGAYSVLSLVGILLVGYGYGQAKIGGLPLWETPGGLRHLALVLVPVAFVLVVSAYVPTGHIKAAVRHPMVLGIALWALGHLLANATAADLVLFGGFLGWGIVDYINALGRTGPAARPVARGYGGDIAAVGIGLVLAAIFIGGLHEWLFGVAPIA